MVSNFKPQENQRWRRACVGVAIVVAALTLSGCAQFLDDLTAVSPEGGFRNNMAYRWQLLTTRPDPLEVLRDSTDGDMRTRAYRALKEPKTEQDREFMLNLLGTAAQTEKQTLCRLAAVETLASFKDPRASAALMEAYRQPVNANDSNAVVRMAIVKSLANASSPETVHLLTEAVAQDSSRDVRMAAAQALGKHQDYRATQALVQVLKDEKDVALRDQARLSLTQITGKNLPAKAEAWEAVFQPANEHQPVFATGGDDSAVQQTGHSNSK